MRWQKVASRSKRRRLKWFLFEIMNFLLFPEKYVSFSHYHIRFHWSALNEWAKNRMKWMMSEAATTAAQIINISLWVNWLAEALIWVAKKKKITQDACAFGSTTINFQTSEKCSHLHIALMRDNYRLSSNLKARKLLFELSINTRIFSLHLSIRKFTVKRWRENN